MLPVPPSGYGGIERVIDMLVRELAARGHDIELYAHADSTTPCSLVPYPGRTASRPRDIAANALTVSRLLTRRPDVVHSFGRLAYLLTLLPTRIPKIMSYQRPPTPRSVRQAMVLARRETLWFTGCSEHITRTLEPFAPARTVYNGVNVSLYTPRYDAAADAPLVFLGRLERIKGAHTAIHVALAAKRRLVLAGNVPEDSGSQRYFTEEIAPHLDGEQIRHIGPVDDTQKNALLGEAAALLMPVEWEEPFGIVMAEALACGTPVLGFRRGAVPEIVHHGVTGFVCDTSAEMVELANRVTEIDRQSCRKHCIAHFSERVIVDGYEQLYRERIDNL